MLNVVLILAASLVAALLYGAHRWRAGTARLRARLDAARLPIEPALVDLGALETLPPPVRCYLRAALEDGQPMAIGCRIRHRGSLDLGEEAPRWKAFTSDQKVVTRPPGFDWDARVRLVPGISVRVHDAYHDGEGRLSASLFGLFALADQRSGGPLAEGELMRYLAEAVWYPTAFLPGQGVAWEAAGERSARATLRDGTTSASLVFTFGDDGLVDRVRAEARARSLGGEVVPTPWQGRFWNYRLRGGMRVPIEAEVAWLPPEGAKAYWRGRIEHIRYETAGADTEESGPEVPP